MNSLLARIRPVAAAGDDSTTVDRSAAASAPLVALELEIRGVLDTPPRPGEQLEAAFRRKEHMLGELFARLSVMDARTLHHRLDVAHAGDELAASFGRLRADRRARLLAFLADARRREAMRFARRIGSSHG
jgi:hypothetical protein